MQNTAAKIRGHLQIRYLFCHVHMQIRDLFVMFMSAPRYGKLSVGFQSIRIRENSTMNNNIVCWLAVFLASPVSSAAKYGQSSVGWLQGHNFNTIGLKMVRLNLKLIRAILKSHCLSASAMLKSHC
jgi:hypothetical protein